ncbi:UDP-N-acetylmuramate--L-alanine ligase [Acidipropionibacterium acidipropionici]|uniref:UDP-N-acetylmuramate--L-alanine ligase n=1 Tax=Acidipropionibacterium acidipropionici TaxID=1748 RepID=A0AAC9AP99_9ACTN|nr:UDP-N-acetylmuramate--L-alanine ligase [Acidipropionibacterium acidipropionici]AMS06790.1 UDP-N-acetylmuramate--alanine ligase [Acidipropionibacterium acidipropionici]AOZ45576.1 UDP-N-acetylmuramate--L-alanine ligase [Acidipropionibacterium acidipropionici]AZP38415.1 UDP-N-acetylmuramate--L-alanine ligase [Acidipropionibacterium acidipropionici]QCV95359.1 UDP-N-acetylmuramate--L-alanine ligase [Acidipropionibacterium acidipropionici]
MALREPVDLADPHSIGPVHFIAIGGAGMSGVARIYQELGVSVSGSDQVDSANLRALAEAGVRTWVGHDPSHLDGARTVVVSSAIRPDNPELVEANRRGLRIWHRSAALAALMLGREGVSVAGTHGKTTTTGMIAVMLAHAGADPSYVIGSPLASTGRSAHLGGGSAFVVEADESDGSFLQYPSRIVVVTNVEADHLDNWGTPDAYFDGFVRMATRPEVRYVVANLDDPGAAHLVSRLASTGSVQVVTYGEAADADVRFSDLDLEGATASATLTSGRQSGRLDLQVPGRYNLSNAAAAYCAGSLLGIGHDELLAGAASFTGTLRRFQLIGSRGGVRVYDDYAHHPTEIRATLVAARRAAGQGRVIACFQPHLYSRTQEFAHKFGVALALADRVLVTDIYGSREDPVPGVTGALVEAAVEDAGGSSRYVPDKGDLPAALAEEARPGDLIITLGAGDVTLVGPLLLPLLPEDGAEREPTVDRPGRPV